MPLSELYRMSNRKFESVPQKNNTCSTDLSFIPDNDFVELVWDSGQIMMQGQSSKAKNTSNSNTLPTYDLPSQIFKSRDKDVRIGVNSKMGRFGTTDSTMNNFPPPVPSGEMGMSQDDDMAPWLNYHIDDSLQHDYCSDFLTESSRVTENELSTSQNNFSMIEKRTSYNQTHNDSHSFSVNNGPRMEQRTVSKVVDGEVYKHKTSNLETSFPSYKSRISDPNINDKRDLNRIQSSSSDYSSIKMPKQDPVLPNSSPSLVNFSHFSRTAAMIKASYQNIGAVTGRSLPSVERIGSKDKRSEACFDNPAGLTIIGSSNGLRTKTSFDHQFIAAPKTVDEPRVCEKSDSICHVDAPKDDKIQTVEPAVASSSACSVNSVDKNSNGMAHGIKRKFGDTEDSDCPSDDIEEESIGAKKAAPAQGGSGSKRRRAAEVHNLSERRRRDRINEKMRALQELIPYCNKVDKASMLDEAIEYLKTLQLQVQIMSMGAGMYMPPMMLPTGMQHMHAPHMAHFSPTGMGMGMNFGMGMVDVNSGSLGYPVMQMPHMPGPHLRGQPISGPSRMHGMPGNLFGVTGQGLAMPMHHSSKIPLSARPDMTIGEGSSQPGSHIRNMNSAQASSLKDPVQKSNLQVLQSSGANSMINQMSTQEKNRAL